MSKKNSEGYFYQIPALLVESVKGNMTKAMLFGLLSNLCKKEGYCWASNKFLSEQLGRKDKSIISQYLTELQEEGWINIESEDFGNNRRIFVNFTPRKKPIPHREKPMGGIGKNLGDPLEKTSTTINNTNKNTDIIFSKEKIDNIPSEPNGQPKALSDQKPHVVGLSGAELKVTTNNSVTGNATGGEETEKKTRKKKSSDDEYINKLEQEFMIPPERRVKQEWIFSGTRYAESLYSLEMNKKNKRSIIIGRYFNYKDMQFPTAKVAYAEFKRNLKVATILAEYPVEELKNTFEYLCNSDFGNGFSWTLETVAKQILHPEIASGERLEKELSGNKKKNNGSYF